MLELLSIGGCKSLDIFTYINDDGYDTLCGIILDDNDVEIARMDDIDLWFSKPLVNQLHIEEMCDAFYNWCEQNTKLIAKWLLRHTISKVVELIKSAVRSIKKDEKTGDIIAFFSGIFTTIFKIVYKVVSFIGKVISFFTGLFGIFSLCFG